MKKIILLTFLFTVLFYQLNSQQQFNYVNVNNPASFNDLSILDEEAKKYNFYFSGENHLFSTTNSKLEFKLLSYFHEKHDVDNMILEFGYGSGWLVNRFVNEKNPEIKKIINLYFGQDFIDLFESVKTYNESQKNKVAVNGIDLQRSFELSFEILNLMLPNDSLDIHDSISREIELIRYMQGYVRAAAKSYNEGGLSYSKKGYNIYNVVNSLETNYTKHKKIYSDYLGVNFIDFDKTLSSLIKTVKWKNYTASRNPYATIYREQEIFNNLNQLVKEKPNQKFYGQFGRAHIAKQRYTIVPFGMYNFKPFVAKINTSKNPYMTNKALSMGIFYANKDGKSTYQVYGNESIQKAFSELPIDSVAISTVNKEGVDSIIKSHYEYIIINNKSLYKEAKKIYEPNYLGFEFNFGFYDMDLGNLNTFFGTSLKSEPLQYIGINYYTFEDFGFYGEWGGSYYLPLKESISDTVSIKFSGWNFHISVGHDIIKSHNFHLIPMIGINYQRMKINVEQDIATNFTGITSTDYDVVNPALMLDGRLSMRVKLFKNTSLSINGGYLFDLSDPKWKYEGDKIDAKNSLSGLYYSAGLAFDVQ